MYLGLQDLAMAALDIQAFEVCMYLFQETPWMPLKESLYANLVVRTGTAVGLPIPKLP